MKQILALFLLLNTMVYSQSSDSSVWILDNLFSVAGFVPSELNELPSIVETMQGKAALFDGKNDGMLIASNPLEGASSFTIEVIFRPDSSANPINLEQRFLHIRNLSNDSRRILIELRLIRKQLWSLDTFIRSENSSCTLLDTLDSNKLHPVGKWYHIALVYDKGIMQHFVNGEKEMSGNVTYLQIDSTGRTSIGSRQDPRSWFKGAIRLIKFTKHALSNFEFISLNGRTPSEFQLFQNYPNPFNPSTLITYQLNSPQEVNLKVYDTLGREIDTLVKKNETAGLHNIEYNANKLPNGIYYYQLIAGNKSITRKMSILR
jgi:hypothetical protein